MANPETPCRVCGCTDSRACPGGCYWIEQDLCSACVNVAEASAPEFVPLPRNFLDGGET